MATCEGYSPAGIRTEKVLPNGRSGASIANINDITVGVGSIELFQSTHRTLLTSRTTVGSDPSDLQLVHASWTENSSKNRCFFNDVQTPLSSNSPERRRTLLATRWTFRANIMGWEQV